MTVNTDVIRARSYLQDKLIARTQQKKSKFRGKISEMKITGKSTSINRSGLRNMSQVTDVHGDTPIVAQSLSRRVLNAKTFNDGDMLDKKQIREIEMDIRPFIIEEMVNAYNREIDKICYDALIGTALAGEDGGTSVALTDYESGAHKIAHGSAGLTKAKILQAKRKMMLAGVDFDNEPAFLFIDSKGWEDLIEEDDFTSMDFVDAKANITGQVGKILGFNVVHVNVLDGYGSTDDYRALAMVPSAGMLGIGEELRIEMAERADKQFNYQVYVETTLGAVRLHEEKVIDIRLS